MTAKKISEIIQNISKNGNLRQKVANGTIWLTLGGGFEQGLRLVRNMILTRLIAPESMGSMAIILAVNVALESFTQVGIKEAVIQNDKGLDKKLLNSAWWVLFIRSLLLSIAGIVSAPAIATFFKTDDLTFLFRLSFLSVILNGTISTGTYAALKRMEYRRWVCYYYGGGFTGVTTTILLSLYYPGIHALVIGYIAESLFRTVYSYILFSFKPTFQIASESIKPLLNFAKGMFGLPLFFFIFSRTDIFVLGKMCTTDEVGLYSMAASIAQIPSTFIIMIIEPVILPLLAKFKDQKNKLSDIVLKILKVIILSAFPLLSVCFIYKADILEVLFGKEYSVMGNTFMVLLFVSLLKVLNIPLASVYFAIGRPDYQRFSTILRAMILLVIIVPFIIFFGVIGASIAVLTALVIAFIFQLVHFNRLLKVNFLPIIFVVLKSVLLSLPIIMLSIIPINNTFLYNIFSVSVVLLTVLYQARLCFNTIFKIEKSGLVK
ncbi:MAG TPA: oligosaccharide flippase family protein [Chitinispirillaceae bacterium]|nr:oligosaccharide flippase family protein [Chitinispirillaceae bacterium]